jgi:hypothetical protein
MKNVWVKYDAVRRFSKVPFIISSNSNESRTSMGQSYVKAPGEHLNFSTGGGRGAHLEATYDLCLILKTVL